jgi:hypothetical protein
MKLVENSTDSSKHSRNTSDLQGRNQQKARNTQSLLISNKKTKKKQQGNIGETLGKYQMPRKGREGKGKERSRHQLRRKPILSPLTLR